LRNRTGLQAPTYFEAGKPAAAAAAATAGKKKKKTKRTPLAPASRLQRTLPVAVGRLFILAMIVNLRELKYTVPQIKYRSIFLYY
jgi:hypothetical protein